MTDIDKAALEAALENLRTHQKQLDADGIMVGVSRQALEEVLAYFDALTEGDTEEPARVNHTLNSYIANCPTKGSVNVPRESLESIAASIAAQAAEIAELRRSCEGGGGSYACRDCPDADYCMSAGACLHVSEAAPQATDDDLVEPSDTERSEWPVATEDYVYGLECIKLSQAARIRYLEAENRALLAAENREGKWALHPASQVAVAAYEAGQADAEEYRDRIEQLTAERDAADVKADHWEREFKHHNNGTQLWGWEWKAKAEAAEQRAEKMRLALDSLLEPYVNMINSGDCGNWNPEGGE